MTDKNLIIEKLEGFSGIRLKGNGPLIFKPGINLLVGRNGCGKSNLIQLIHLLATGQLDLRELLESSYLVAKSKQALEKGGTDIWKAFGKPTIVKHSLLGEQGSVKIFLKDTSRESVVKNLMMDPTNFYSGIGLVCDTTKATYGHVYANNRSPKFEMDGYPNTSQLFSRQPDNAIHNSVNDAMQTVTKFIKEKMNLFYESTEFASKLDAFEDSINQKFNRFLNTSNKRLKINRSDLTSSGRIQLSLMDGDNYIQSSHLSAGEGMLYNLVASLTAAKQDKQTILCLDEPDIHMHDDMIRVLTSELRELSQENPSCIIIVASHSTALIEQLASLGKAFVQIITFDNERNVSNSDNDIDLINALQRNGVHFSPIMLSKRRNILIENKFTNKNNHTDFLLKFFPSSDIPNIIPVGTSDNVKDSESFSGIFESLLKFGKLDFVGIQDGDIWFKTHLKKYLQDQMTLEDFIMLLKKQTGMYIHQRHENSNSNYFNCWEIENVFLQDELIKCWQLQNNKKLTTTKFRSLIRSNNHIIIEQYFKTFFKDITKVRIDKKYSVKALLAFTKKRFSTIESTLNDSIKLDDRMAKLVNSILDNGLYQWIPGKEIKTLLENSGYAFNDSEFNFEKSKLAAQICKII